MAKIAEIIQVTAFMLDSSRCLFFMVLIIISRIAVKTKKQWSQCFELLASKTLEPDDG
ncbi:MAG TPA: hypothetical protein PKI63_00350 [Candidatus Cloacimonadota bacterium]|jgi:hypothetical protein|nr:hypothetical protein [Candidatus Cloacimonadota bacterium]